MAAFNDIGNALIELIILFAFVGVIFTFIRMGEDIVHCLVCQDSVPAHYG